VSALIGWRKGQLFHKIEINERRTTTAVYAKKLQHEWEARCALY
jgi:hypothetical protein